MNNLSLRQQPRDQKAPIIQASTDSSILSWLEGTGRLMDRDIPIDPALLEEMDELSRSLIGSDDTDYDDEIEEDGDE
ncbi:MAG: DUF3134 domain-containing protein [Thermosynechococcaceae cyanobacterium MS004]|nr:DUF3134 domain-containing protein [Thermosynechococcaceae cyanobacterium MS004]